MRNIAQKRVLVSLAVVATLASCGEAREAGLNQPLQRDVYKSKADCEKDWKGKSSLCERIPENQNQTAASSTSHSHYQTHYAGGYWGPMYYSGTRSVQMSNGETVTPTSNLSQAKPYVVSPSATPHSSHISKPATPPARSGISSGSVSRGGFGGFGGRGGGG